MKMEEDKYYEIKYRRGSKSTYTVLCLKEDDSYVDVRVFTKNGVAHHNSGFTILRDLESITEVSELYAKQLVPDSNRSAAKFLLESDY